MLRAELSLGLGKSLVWHGPIEPQDIRPILATRPDLIPVVSRRMDLAHATAREIIRERKADVMAIARVLVAMPVLTGDETRQIIARVKGVVDDDARIAPR